MLATMSSASGSRQTTLCSSTPLASLLIAVGALMQAANSTDAVLPQACVADQVGTANKESQRHTHPVQEEERLALATVVLRLVQEPTFVRRNLYKHAGRTAMVQSCMSSGGMKHATCKRQLEHAECMHSEPWYICMQCLHLLPAFCAPLGTARLPHHPFPSECA